MNADCLLPKQTSPTSFLSCDTVGREIIVDSDYTYYSDHPAAVALSKALDLLSDWAIDCRRVLPLVSKKTTGYVARFRDLER